MSFEEFDSKVKETFDNSNTKKGLHKNISSTSSTIERFRLKY